MSVKLFAASLAFDLKVSPHGLFYAPASILCSSYFNSLRQCSFARHHLEQQLNDEYNRLEDDWDDDDDGMETDSDL